MRAITHQLFALSGFLAAFPVLAHDWTGLLLQSSAVACGALLPDLDSPHSAFGRRVRPLSVLLNRLLTHRGALHSLLVGCAVGALLTIYTPLKGYGGLIGLGWLSHVVGDLFFTSQSPGVALFWPYPKKVSLLRLSVGGLMESIFSLLLLVVIACCLYWRSPVSFGF